jgi:hypothetical protein
LPQASPPISHPDREYFHPLDEEITFQIVAAGIRRECKLQHTQILPVPKCPCYGPAQGLTFFLPDKPAGQQSFRDPGTRIAAHPAERIAERTR